jgi:hypothetical protein
VKQEQAFALWQRKAVSLQACQLFLMSAFSNSSEFGQGMANGKVSVGEIYSMKSHKDLDRCIKDKSHVKMEQV